MKLLLRKSSDLLKRGHRAPSCAEATGWQSRAQSKEHRAKGKGQRAQGKE